SGVQIATWNDYEEGTAMEPGIDNCIYLTPSQSGTTIQWGVSGGDESTIDHYSVFISTDGKNLSKLTDVPAGTHSIDLSQWSLAQTTYSVYVKAVGKPSIQNKMSPAIAYRPGDTPPGVKLAVSQTGPLTFAASTAGSSGNIASTQIDFGDGTVASGTSGSHTYKTVGTYLVTATVFDSAGASAVAVQQISAKPQSGGITILSPGDGSTVNWPTTLQAAANPGTPVAAMRVMIDGTEAYAANGDTLNTVLKVFTGTHQITVQSLDSGGNVTASASVNVIAEPANVPPVAKISLKAMPGISATTVLGCMANSTGSVSSYHLQYSNGSQFTTPAALETFAAPGTYKATVTVTDEFGATNSTTTTFTLGNGTISAIPVPALSQQQ
ncbi:MAG TPA: PKD domain-containing protein, partial [Terracidiphilus sp.]